MTTTVLKKVGGASSGRDYASLSAAFAALPASLVTADQQWIFELYNDSAFGGSASLSNIPTSATQNIIIRCAAGQSFNTNASKNTNALFPNQANGVYSGGASITIDCKNVLVQGIQFVNQPSGFAFSFGSNADSTTKASQCIFYASNGSAASNSGAGVFVNCLFITDGYNFSLQESGSANPAATIRNCTAISPVGGTGGGGRYGFSAGNFGNSNSLLINCESYGFGTDFNGSYTGSDYNVSDDTTAPGTHTLKSAVFANQFINTTTDFRRKSGSTVQGFGTPDSANTGDVDILGNPRSTTAPSAGAIEYYAAPSAPTNSTPPTITGTAQVGQTLTCSTGSWTGTPTSYSYQWKRAGTAISGATSSTYVPVTGDIGSTLTCSVIATNAGGPSTASTSSPTAAVIAAALTAGTATAGATSASTAAATATDATNGTSPYLYQWFRSTASGSLGTAVSGQTTRTLADTGLSSSTPYYYTLRYTDSAGTPGVVYSNQITETTAAPGALTVSGTAGSGNVGTAYTATFTASGGTAPYTYSVGSGALPAGVTLNTSTGVISGTPTTVATYTFVIHAVDSST